MLPTDVLSRRGPLGKVWLAAHMERKLSKTQTLQTDIEESVDAIMDQEIEFMALRFSGQLLLGVVRIYSRKAKYLLDDCNEALLKIKMAFRPGVVDMTEEQLVANKNTITIQANAFDLDLLMPDPNWLADIEERPVQVHGQHQAHIDDITLRPTDIFDPFDYPQDNFDLGPSDGIGSQEYLDLELTFDEPLPDEEQNQDSMSVDGSVGVGRDAVHLDSIDAQFMDRGGMDYDMLSNKSRSRDPSEHPFGPDMNVDMPDFDGIDLGELNIGFGDDDVNMDGLPKEGEKTPGQTRSPSRASSPLTEIPLTPPPPDLEADATPNATKGKRKMKEKKQIIDSVTELQDGTQDGNRGRNAAPSKRDVSGILTEPHFLPKSSVVMRLMEIHNDPLAHFLPTKVTPNGTYFCAAPPGLAPELAEMFMRPLQNISNKRRGGSPGKSPNKRRRVDEQGNEADEVELGRRAVSQAPSIGMGSDVFRRESQGPDGLDFPDQMGMDDFQLDVPEVETAGVDLDRARSKSAAPTDRSRMSTPVDGIPDEGDENYADLTCPIAVFDARPQTQSQATEKESEPTDNEGKGYSRNTVKALSIIRKELRPTDGDERVLSFEKMADKASRRAAASFFFELLVLSTRDCIQVAQAAPFENIEVRAKDKLWERGPLNAPSRLGSVAPSAAPSRAPSVARSLASAMGL
ncbi:hypothetical protein D9758_001863 [Tetrapyrgos nigripes]|uniref:Cohesin subunit rad21 n=1 Tax=Tetrapyrgos nigripes TaxID=182062 RepID=A0A8H5GTK7_9AGAR|nr:hypothetical protein D9758_001863 [Tetrapyrgos nigripes]